MHEVVVVFDTSVLLSGVGWLGPPFQCLQLARSGNVSSVTCNEILAELEEKLVLKRRLSTLEAAQVIRDINSFSRVVSITRTLQAVPSDPDDDMIVECAVVGNATHIVTGDKRHLLPLGSCQGIQIVTAADFIAHVAKL